MASWRDIETASPDFAARVQKLFARRRHKLLATLRRDGSPRISGIETEFTDGEIVLGMMPGSRKVDDLRRDPRLALHASSDDPDEDEPAAWAGDAKLAGRAVESAGTADAVRFRLDVFEVVLTYVGDPPDHLVIESWHEGGGLRRVERR